ncbi:hypothetical protein MLD52_11465 [Puniceicoccaceae bacterium K14]|nr:hypothetical protein [Puniceicoccaceae bacterium K14]
MSRHLFLVQKTNVFSGSFTTLSVFLALFCFVLSSYPLLGADADIAIGKAKVKELSLDTNTETSERYKVIKVWEKGAELPVLAIYDLEERKVLKKLEGKDESSAKEKVSGVGVALEKNPKLSLKVVNVNSVDKTVVANVGVSR